MRRKGVICFLLLSLVLQGCGGVSQSEYDTLKSENETLTKEIDESKEKYDELQKKYTALVNEKAEQVSSEVDLAYPKSLVSTYICDEYSVLSDSEEYVEIVCKDSYEPTKKSISRIHKSIKEMQSGIAFLGSSMNFKRMCFKFCTDDGKELLSYTFVKDEKSYTLDSVSISTEYSNVISSAILN